jgi:hypothetical protein
VERREVPTDASMSATTALDRRSRRRIQIMATRSPHAVSR